MATFDLDREKMLKRLARRLSDEINKNPKVPPMEYDLVLKRLNQILSSDSSIKKAIGTYNEEVKTRNAGRSSLLDLIPSVGVLSSIIEDGETAHNLVFALPKIEAKLIAPSIRTGSEKQPK